VPTVPTAPIAFASLVAGFAVADLTGVRPLGGLVLLAAGLWLAREWRRRRGDAVMWTLGVTYAAGFAISHQLGDLLGTWGAVLTVSAVAGGAAWALADRQGAGRPVPA
jgi:hypothetical protein